MKSLSCLSAILLSVSCLNAGDTAVVDPDLPQPMDRSFAENLVTHSPFTRSVNLEDTLQLTGIAYVNGRPVATVLNKQTKERVLVFEEPNALGWQLLAANAGTDPSNSQIELKVGPETITMHYHGQEMSTDGGGKGGSKTRLAGGGNSKDGDKMKPSALLGDQGREMYASLSSNARDKFKDLMKSRLEKHPELTPEQNADYAQKVFAKLKATDQPSSGNSSSARPPKTAKPPKKKQGT
jgi:hypothetical protein